MMRDTFTFLVGGKAGDGVKKAGSVAANLFSRMGRWVFEMDDYQSLIRGGHNFSTVSTALREITSQYEHADIVVALDRRSYEQHRGSVGDGGILIYNSDEVPDGEGVGIPMTSEGKRHLGPGLGIGIGSAAALCAAVGHTREELEDLIRREYSRGLDNNVAYANAVYAAVLDAVGVRFDLESGDHERQIVTGNQAIALGAAAAGLDVYVAYPMTPSSTLLHFLAKHDDELSVTVMHPESEIAAANIAIGAAAVGARAMVGSSGGGFALMEEALSLAGMAEVPLLCLMSSRPGPSTGVPTYTEQADLRFALNQGHGEFTRVVASPGSIGEAFRVTAELMEIAWLFQTVAIVLTEKHLSESSMTVEIDVEGASWAEPVIHEGGDYARYRDVDDGVSPLLFPPSDELIKWTSYEHDELGITTEEGPAIALMHDKRNRKLPGIEEHMRGMKTVNRFEVGGGGRVILTYGSTTMRTLEALAAGGISATVVQPIYLEPFPHWELEEIARTDPIVVEQSSTGQFATLLREKAGIQAAAVIMRYDGRPFDPVGLARKIREVIA